MVIHYRRTQIISLTKDFFFGQYKAVFFDLYTSVFLRFPFGSHFVFSVQPSIQLEWHKDRRDSGPVLLASWLLGFNFLLYYCETDKRELAIAALDYPDMNDEDSKAEGQLFSRPKTEKFTNAEKHKVKSLVGSLLV